MNIRALPAGVQRFALADLPSEPWRNGGGQTRTVAATHVGARLRWRVSAADITQPGPFSVFDGVDRTAVLMRGPGLALQGPLEQPLAAGAQQRWVFEGVGALARFPGDLPLQALPGPGGMARLLNVMVDRETLRADVQVHRAESGRLDGAVAGVLVVLEGALEVGLDDAPPLLTLGPDEGLLLSDLSQPLALRAPQGPAQWVTTTFLSR